MTRFATIKKLSRGCYEINWSEYLSKLLHCNVISLSQVLKAKDKTNEILQEGNLSWMLGDPRSSFHTDTTPTNTHRL